MAHQFRRMIATATLLLAAAGTQAAEFITVASTTSTDQSGLFGHLLPLFTARSGIEVRIIAQGTGQALDTGRRGDADVLFVHDRPAEDKFVAAGYGIERRDVMYNDFVLVGPKADPAHVRQTKDIVEAFRRIANADLFVSRGDKSGTHAAELRFWKDAGVDPKAVKGYKEAGAGMGPTLNIAASLGAYTLADRGTWLSFKNRRDLDIVLAGDRRLFNAYGTMLVNPARHPHVRARAGRQFIDWLVSAEGQAAIAAFKIGGEQLFFPDAKK